MECEGGQDALPAQNSNVFWNRAEAEQKACAGKGLNNA
jgi:hypothetical protein